MNLSSKDQNVISERFVKVLHTYTHSFTHTQTQTLTDTHTVCFIYVNFIR